MCNLVELDSKRREEMLNNSLLETVTFILIVFGPALVMVLGTPIQSWLIAALAFVAMVAGFGALRLR